MWVSFNINIKIMNIYSKFDIFKERIEYMNYIDY